MFRKFRRSLKEGLLSDTISRWLIVIQTGISVSVLSVVINRIERFDGSLPLRFATSEGYYDEGGWYRPLLLILFVLLVSVISLALSSSLFAQKDRELARGIIVCSLGLLLIALQIALNFIIPGQV